MPQNLLDDPPHKNRLWLEWCRALFHGLKPGRHLAPSEMPKDPTQTPATARDCRCLKASVPSIVLSMGTSTAETSERCLTSIAFQIAKQVLTSITLLWKIRFAHGEKHK